MTPGILKVEGPEPQAGLINRLAAALFEDKRVLACWLRGSFATGRLDRYSDIDMAIAVDDDQFHYAFQAAREAASAAGECIVSWDSPKDVNGAGFTAFYADCSFLDLKVYRASRVPSAEHREPTRTIFEREGVRRVPSEPLQEESLGPPLREQVWWKMVYMWICVYSAVRFIKREDYWYAAGMINAVRGTLAQIMWLWTRRDEPTDMSFIVWGVVRRDLDPELTGELEATVSDAERSEMVRSLLKLVEIFEARGRQIASDTGAEYPEKLANVVSSYFRQECLPEA